MLSLRIKFNDGSLIEHKFAGDKTLYIGRLDDNDVVIKSPSVSGHHAKIDPVGDGFLLTDLKSTNGCFVNEQFVQTHWLKLGDVITMGDVTLIFSCEPETVSKLPSMLDNANETMMLSNEEYEDMRAKSFLSKALGGSEGDPMINPALSFIAGGVGEVRINKEHTRIGKDLASDVVIHGFLVGKTAASVEMKPDGYYLKYVGGFIKPKVNGKTVKKSAKIREFDIIKIGPAKLQVISEL